MSSRTSTTSKFSPMMITNSPLLESTMLQSIANTKDTLSISIHYQISKSQKFMDSMRMLLSQKIKTKLTKLFRLSFFVNHNPVEVVVMEIKMLRPTSSVIQFSQNFQDYLMLKLLKRSIQSLTTKV